MELVERDDFLDLLDKRFRQTSAGEGHCFFITGEAGIGKSSLVRAFLKEIEKVSIQFVGSCDLLFTPRPLAPLYDVAFQMKNELSEKISTVGSRSELFSKFAEELSGKGKSVVLVFEDVHWADEATLDFIKFFARRITQTNCLFILTWRDDDIHGQHPLRNVLGHLVPGTFTRAQLTALSKTAVQQMAEKRGYNGEDVFHISGGNPFYVNEILANYSPGIPDNIKDSVLYIYEDLSDETKNTWQLLSVIPEGLEFQRFTGINDYYLDSIANCMAKKILIVKNEKLSFKHELYRRTIEESLSPFKRIELNKNVIDLFLKTFEANGEIERIVHYAKNANEYDLVVHYAPIAAKQAAGMGAHIEAAKLYLTAIEYYQGNDKNLLVQLYEAYAYECYLTTQLGEAIIYEASALNIWKEKDNKEMWGNAMCFLSTLWWYNGDRLKSQNFAEQAIELLKDQSFSKAKAAACCSMADLKFHSGETGDCFHWVNEAIAIAEKINEEEIAVYALITRGAALMLISETAHEGISLLQQSREKAFNSALHEQAARAYTLLASAAVSMGAFALAEMTLNEGLAYCDEKNLHSHWSYMQGCKAICCMETGKWGEGYTIVNSLLEDESILPVIKMDALVVSAILKMRKGETTVLPLLEEAKEKAFKMLEPKRVLPVVAAFLEYEWITGINTIEDKYIDRAIEMINHSQKSIAQTNFVYWLLEVRKEYCSNNKVNKGLFDINNLKGLATTDRPYYHALALAAGNEKDKKEAVSILRDIGADAVFEKLKQEMRNSGIKNIPRGIRETTRSNPALLTNRELDVLSLLNEGIQNKEIAARLYISAKTVDNHISSIFFKLDMNSRAKAVAEAKRLGIIK